MPTYPDPLPSEPVYYKVVKSTSEYNSYDYELVSMPAARLGRYKPKSLWAGFDSREEAVRHAQNRGWVKVSTWKEAEKLAKTWLDEQRAARAARDAAYEESLKTTALEAAKALEDLAPGGDALTVWIGADGVLRKRWGKA